MAQSNTNDTGATPEQLKAAEIATTQARLNLRKTILLGTFGSESAPGALLRLPSGDVIRVTRGDPVAGGEIAAIDADKVVIAHGGRTTVLTAPR